MKPWPPRELISLLVFFVWGGGMTQLKRHLKINHNDEMMQARVKKEIVKRKRILAGLMVVMVFTGSCDWRFQPELGSGYVLSGFDSVILETRFLIRSCRAEDWIRLCLVWLRFN